MKHEIPFDPKALRAAFGSYMTGVTVITALTDKGEMVGFTANSFTSVSLSPPLLLVCPGKHLSSYAVFEQAGHFAVNVLAEGQEPVSNFFASAIEDRFSKVEWSADADNCPLIAGTAASFSCRVHQRHPAGDHMILVGEVTQYQHSNRRGLGYCSTGYFSLGKERQADAAADSERPGTVAAIVECDHQVLLTPESEYYCIPCVNHSNRAGARSALREYFESAGLQVDIGPVYSVYDDARANTKFTVFRATAHSTEAAGLGRYEAIEKLASLPYPDKAQSIMMARYASEHSNRHFGLYVGDDESGEFHLLDKGQD